MIRANELRIGNFVLHEGRIAHVLYFTSKRIALKLDYSTVKITAKKNFEEILIEPIPLTPAWFDKFGFTYENAYDCICWSVTSQDLKLEINQDDWSEDKGKTWNHYFCFNYWTDMKDSNYMKTNLLYVHQLQNLYFALTGEELMIQS